MRKQKRDLSDQSNEDDDKKRARGKKFNLSLSNDDTDIFEVIKSPRCASILYICLQNLEKKVNGIFECMLLSCHVRVSEWIYTL